MTFGDWDPSRRIEEEYQWRLSAMMGRFRTFAHLFGAANPEEVLSAMMAFFGSEDFRQWSLAATSRMVTGLFTDNARTWREAARKSMRGRMVYGALQHEMEGAVGVRVRGLIEDNARYITSLPGMRIGNGRTLREEAADFVQNEALKGRRASAIAQDLFRQFPDVAATRIRSIARTQVSKTSTALTRARAENLDLDWYLWRTSRDGRTRKSHRLMDRVIVAWPEPPAPEEFLGIASTLGAYHAGDAPNCRCYPEPVLDMNQVKWPCKVFHDGVIRMTTRSRFAEMAGAGVRNAA